MTHRFIWNVNKRSTQAWTYIDDDKPFADRAYIEKTDTGWYALVYKNATRCQDVQEVEFESMRIEEAIEKVEAIYE